MLPHDLETVTVNGGERTGQYHTPLAVAKFTGKRKKIKSCYFIATPPIPSRLDEINPALYGAYTMTPLPLSKHLKIRHHYFIKIDGFVYACNEASFRGPTCEKISMKLRV